MRFAHFLACWAINALRASSFTLEDNEDVVAPVAPVGDAKAETPAVEVAAPSVKEVIRVLKALAKRVDVRNRKEDAIFEEFGHYCLKGSTSLEKSLKESQVELPQLQLQLTESDRKRQALLEEMKVQENDEASCKSAFQAARSIRADEVKTYQKDLASLTGNQKRLQDLLATQDAASLAEVGHTGMEKNGTGQAGQAVDAATALQHLSLSSSSSAELLELLQDPAATAGQKIQVAEMLRTMLEGVNKDLSELKASEQKRKSVFEAMERAKAEELQSLQRSLQEKRERDAAFQKQQAFLRLEREDTASVVDDADKLTKTLKNWCDIRRKQHTEMELKMQEETKSLQSASKLLLSGTALEAFKPEAVVTFLQLVQRHESFHQSSSKLKAAHLRGKGPALKKITKLVDSMVDVIEKNQEDDELKIQMCKDEMASTKSTKAALSDKEQSKAADVASLSEQLENLERDVAAEKKAIARVDWVVATARSLREKEHKHLATSIAQGAAAVDVLHKATNSLEKFLNEGGTLGGQASASDDDEFPFFTQAKSSDAGPALRSLAEVISAVKSEVSQVQIREATDQAAYVALLEVAKQSRRKDAFSLTDFVGGQAALATESQKIQDRQKALKEQLGLTDQLATTLADECEKLLADFEEKKKARNQEIDALDTKKKALEVSLANVDLQ